MNRSTPGLSVHHQLPEFTQTHIHRVGDAIQPSHPRSSPSPPAPNPSQHQSLFQWVNSLHQVAKVQFFLDFKKSHWFSIFPALKGYSDTSMNYKFFLVRCENINPLNMLSFELSNIFSSVQSTYISSNMYRKFYQHECLRCLPLVTSYNQRKNKRKR